MTAEFWWASARILIPIVVIFAVTIGVEAWWRDHE